MASDTYYCGHCRRYQREEQGEKCVSCGRQTLTVGHMYENGKKREETSQELDARWKRLYG